MNNPEADGLATANQPVDETDFEILGRVRKLFGETDPMPAGLPGRIRFTLALHDLETEMARVAEVWERVNQSARDVDTFNLERKPLVFNVFGWLAEASRG